MDYFSQGRRRAGTSSTGQTRLNTPQRPQVRPQASRDTLRPPSSIRLRRLASGTPSVLSSKPSSRPASQASDELRDQSESQGIGTHDAAVTGRRRSSSAPQEQQWRQGFAPPGTDLSRQATGQAHMEPITEGRATATTPYYEAQETPRPYDSSINLGTSAGFPGTPGGGAAMQQAAGAARQNRGLRRFRSGTVGHAVHPRHRTAHDEYESDVVDLLDLVDPEVRTIGTLTNVQNSLFVPDLGGLLNRRPTYELTTRRSDLEGGLRSRAGTRASQRPVSSRLPTITQASTGGGTTPGDDVEMEEQQPRRTRAGSLTSQLSDSHYAVLPHGVDLEGWTKEDIDDLNDHVRHLLHSRREGFKRSMRGFRKYLSKPLGLFVFVYATLVTLFGAAWVFCLIGWIYVGSEQDYFINVIDNVLVALFALIGDGLAPFRAVDTYHMCFIAHYHHLTWRLRQEKKMPNLVDHNDLPDRRVSLNEQEDIIDKEETAEFSVLSPRQQRRLQYHQAKFSKAHTFYKPHETSTHHAFPLRLLVAVVVLLDCHSLFQVALGTCTWSIDYHVRPQALTATILSCSITCNIVAGVLISIGDHRTRKKDVLERMFRQGLTEEAIMHIQKKKTMQEDLANGVDDAAVGRTSGADVRRSEPQSERPSGGDDIEPAFAQGWNSIDGSSQEKGRDYTV